MNIGATYDGDFGNECVMCDGKIIFGTRTEEEIKIPDNSGTYGDDAKKAFKLSKVSQEITLTLREPVMCEPLDYYSTRSGNKTMNNVTSIDLEYNFNNLRNMIIFNHAKLLDAADKREIKGNLTVYDKE